MATRNPLLLMRVAVTLAAAALTSCGGKTFLHLLDETQQTTGQAVHTYCQTIDAPQRHEWESNINAHADGDCLLIYCATQHAPTPHFESDCKPPPAPQQ